MRRRSIEGEQAPPGSWWSRHRRDAPLTIFGLAVVVWIVVMFVLPQSTKRPSWAKRWDPRFEELAMTTSAIRGLPFTHPVTVAELTEHEYVAIAKAEARRAVNPADAWFTCVRGDLTPRPRCRVDTVNGFEEVDPFSSIMRSLGVTVGPLELTSAWSSVVDARELGRYSAERRRIELRGKFQPGMEPLVVHELAHALQDQHFGLGIEPSSFDEALAYRALVEGDAMWVEDRFRQGLDRPAAIQAEASDRRAAEEIAVRERDAVSEDAWLSIPDAVRFSDALVTFVYEGGRSFVSGVRDTGGQTAVDAAFENPPNTTAEVLVVDRLGESMPAVDTGSLREDNQRPAYNARPIRLGAYLWGEVLAADRGESDALATRAAVHAAWDGDAVSVVYDRATAEVCIIARIGLSGPTAGVARAAVMSLGDRGVDVTDDGEGALTVDACDPDTDPDRRRFG